MFNHTVLAEWACQGLPLDPGVGLVHWDCWVIYIYTEKLVLPGRLSACRALYALRVVGAHKAPLWLHAGGAGQGRPSGRAAAPAGIPAIRAAASPTEGGVAA